MPQKIVFVKTFFARRQKLASFIGKKEAERISLF